MFGFVTKSIGVIPPLMLVRRLVRLFLGVGRRRATDRFLVVDFRAIRRIEDLFLYLI